MPKILRQLLMLATFSISAMTYLRASTEDLEDGSQAPIYLAILAMFAGVCESLEVYDHLFPIDEIPEVEAFKPLSKRSTAVVATGFAVLMPSLVLTTWAHKLQGDALATSLRLEEEWWGFVFATPALVKFCAVSVPHILHTLKGDRERFSLSVTNNNLDVVPESSMPPLKWWLMLVILVYLHLPEGDLIATPIKNELMKNLASFGFALSESIPHLNQLEQLPQTIASLVKKDNESTLTSSVLKVGAGVVGGIGSASEAILAAMAGSRSKATAWIAPVVEFVIGFAETQQHLVPTIKKFVTKNKLSDISLFKKQDLSAINDLNQHKEVGDHKVSIIRY